MKTIPPTNDLAFKKALASEENKDILSGLINDFYGIIPEKIILENPYNINDYKEILEGKEINVLRQTYRDISVSIVTANITIELQIQKTAFFGERSVYYPFSRYCQNYNIQDEIQTDATGKINRYSSLKPVYALNILQYTFFQDEDALRIFELYDPVRRKSMHKDFIKIGYFELTKDKIETQNQRHWRDYFNTGKVSEDAPAYIKKALNVIDYVNLREEEKMVVAALEKARALYEEGLVDSFQEGVNIGEAKGIAIGEAKGIAIGEANAEARQAEKTKKIIIRMLQRGISPEIIAEDLEIPLTDVMKFKQEIV